MTKGHKGTECVPRQDQGRGGRTWTTPRSTPRPWLSSSNLGKNKPPKGDDKSWKALTEKYAANTKEVYKGTQDKDAKAVNKGLGVRSVGRAVGHKAHKGLAEPRVH